MPKTSELPLVSSVATTDALIGLISGATSRVSVSSIMALGALTRAQAAALTATAPVAVLTVIHGGVLCYYEKDASGTALTTADGQNWKPASGMPVTPQHFANTTAGRQACWDYAHTSGRPVLLAADITITATEYWGNLTLIAGGGTINIIGDASFAISAGGGPRASEGCIIMRGANANTDYAEAFDTQYLVRMIGRVRLVYTRSDTGAPRGAFLFTGLKEGSVLDFDAITYNNVAGTGAGTNAGTIALYFYNRCTIRGRYEIVFQDTGQLGGLWIQHVAIGLTGPDKKSIVHLDDVISKTNGVDECIGIFTTGYPAGGVNGYIHCTGSATCYAGTSLGFSVLNNSVEDAKGFYVSLDRVTVYASNILTGGLAVRFRNAHAQIANLNIFIEGAAAGATNVRGVSFEDPDSTGAVTQVGNLSVVITDVLACGDNVVDMVQGRAEIQNLQTSSLAGASLPRYSVAAASGTIIHGGDMMDGVSGCLNNVYKITGGIVRGRINNTVHVGEDVTVLWDTDTWGTNILLNNAGTIPTTFPETRTFYFKPRIIATGSATPTQVINQGWTNINHDVDYWLDYAGAGGDPGLNSYGSARGVFRRVHADGSFAVAYRSDRIEWSVGTWVPALSFGGAASGLTYASTPEGKYHVQDGILYYNIDMTLSAKGASTGTAGITLPTTTLGVSITPSTLEGGATILSYANMASITSPIARVETSFAARRVRLFNTGATATGALTEANFTDTSAIRVSGWVPLY